MAKYFLALCLTLFCVSAQAHQPDISTTMLVEREDGSWILQIRAALTGFEYEVKTHYGENAFDTPEKFKELVISHVQENLSIHFNEQDVAILKNAFVKLGHETNVLFEVVGVPEKITSISVKNSSFKDIHRNQSALVIFKNGFEKKQFILNNENEHTVELATAEKTFELLSEDVSSAFGTSFYKISGWLFLGIGGLFILWKIKKKQYHTIA